MSIDIYDPITDAIESLAHLGAVKREPGWLVGSGQTDALAYNVAGEDLIETVAGMLA